MKFLCLIPFLLLSCKANKASDSDFSQKEEIVETPEPCTKVISQGLKGTVTFLEGNVMPGPDRPIPSGEPVEREVWIFPPLERTKTPSEEGVFFFADTSTAITHQLSGKDGCYKITLEPGLYSVLIFEPEKGLFANIFNRTDLIQSVMVEKGKVSELDIEINYKASY